MTEFLQVSEDRLARFDLDRLATPYDTVPYDVLDPLAYWTVDGPKIAKTPPLHLPIHQGVLTDPIVDTLLAFAGMTPWAKGYYDLCSFGVIATTPNEDVPTNGNEA
jgi:hypothetical protein